MKPTHIKEIVFKVIDKIARREKAVKINLKNN